MCYSVIHANTCPNHWLNHHLLSMPIEHSLLFCAACDTTVPNIEWLKLKVHSSWHSKLFMTTHDHFCPLWPYIVTRWYHCPPPPPYYHYTLQDFKLQGIKIHDGVVFSRYSQIIRFENQFSIFWAFTQTLYSSAIERWTCTLEVVGLISNWETYRLLVYGLLYRFKATNTCW